MRRAVAGTYSRRHVDLLRVSSALCPETCAVR
ncbi:putative leader peptide [Streptacidiphilus sp. N1-5]|uniref:Leader peptide n=1 Tax=Streptacidiphilus cavernicola TaxID=3342716 RepID=A0ABV6UN77_9ACTN